MNTTFDAREAAKLMIDKVQVYFLGDTSQYLDLNRKGEVWLSSEGVTEYYMTLAEFLIQCADAEFQTMKPLVKWYRPLIVWEDGCSFPQSYVESDFFKSKYHKSKEKFLKDMYHRPIKVLKWEEIYLPETLAECE